MSFDLQLTASDRCAATPDGEPPPRLWIALNEGNVLLTWPATCETSSYVLEESDSLDGTLGWRPVAGTVDLADDYFRALQSIQQQRVYRLRRL